MADYQLTHPGPTVQQALDIALGVEQQISQEAAAREAADALLATKTELAAETSRAQAAEALLATIAMLDAEIARATGIEGTLQSLIDAINAKIPSAASSANQLADKNFVNSSIGTSSAAYISNNGEPFTSVAQLNAYTGPHDKNDYAFVVSTDAAGNTVYSRYKYDGSEWAKEYDLNNSSFTAAQWAAINSAVTAELVAKLSALPDNATLTAALAAKQDVIDDLSSIRSKANSAYQKPSGGIPKTDLASAVQTSLNKADSAVQDVSDKADKDTDAVEGNVAQFDANGNPVDGGVPAENIAQKDGYYDSMAVGTAKNLEGRTNVTETFLARPTGGEDAELANGLGQVTAVGGNSVKFNQVMRDPSFTQRGYWSNNETYFPNTLSDNTLTGTIKSKSSAVCGAVQTGNLEANHTYYFRVSVKLDSQVEGVAKLRPLAMPGNGTVDIPKKNEWVIVKGIRNFGGNANNRKRIILDYGTDAPYAVDDTLSFRNISIIDLTAIFGAGNEPATVEDFEEWLAQNIGLAPYYAYDAGSVKNVTMTGIESVGRNLLNPTTGKAQILGAYSDVYGNYYGITGTHGTITFTDLSGTSQEITPDSDGKFLIETPGELTVATPGADCAVFLWWDGTQTDYTDYAVDVAKLDVTHIYGKLNGEGELVQVWPTGMRGIGDLKDALKIVDGAVVAEVKIAEVDLGTRTYTKTSANYFWAAISAMKTASTNGVANLMAIPYQAVSYNALTGADKVMAGFTTNGQNRLYINDSSYAESDAAAFKAAMNGVKLLYERATPLLYTDLVYQGSEYSADGTPVTLPVNYTVDNWGVENVLPKGGTVGPTIAIRYAVDAVEQLDTIRSSGIFVEDLKANIQQLLAIVNDKLGETMGGTIAIGSTPTDKVYPFTFVPTPEPEPTPDTTE